MTAANSKQPTVRVNSAAKQKLHKLQEQTDLSQPALMDLAIDLLERKLLASQMEADFAYLANNPNALAKYNRLSAKFEGATGDGLTIE